MVARELWQTTATPQPVSPQQAELAEEEELTEHPEQPGPARQPEADRASG